MMKFSGRDTLVSIFDSASMSFDLHYGPHYGPYYSYNYLLLRCYEKS